MRRAFIRQHRAIATIPLQSQDGNNTATVRVADCADQLLRGEETTEFQGLLFVERKMKVNVQISTELRFHTGEKLAIIRKPTDEQWIAMNVLRQIGTIPSDYVTVISFQ